MYETRDQPLIAKASFLRRVFGHIGVAVLLLGLSLSGGMVGYHTLEGLPWDDAFLNAAMLLGGMGPVDAPQSHAGKLFAGIYALYAGLVFIATAALVFTPVMHRVLHHFQWSD